MLKDLIIGSVAALLGGLAVAGILAFITAPQQSHAAVRYSWIYLPNPADLRDQRDRDKAKDCLSKVPPQVRSAAIDKSTLSQWLRVVWIDVRNRSSQRSGSIEIVLPGAALWVNEGGNPEYASADKFTIDAIDPGEKREITALVPESSKPFTFFHGNPPRVLEAGRSVPVASTRTEDYDDEFGFLETVRDYPFVAAILGIAGIVPACIDPVRARYQLQHHVARAPHVKR
jgi:hypothetical protein